MSLLWDLVWGKAEVDPRALALAIEHELENSEPDYRTRVLIRDGTDALAEHWGSDRMNGWLSMCPVRSKIEAIQSEDLGKVGFPTLKEKLMDMTEPDTVAQFLRELGSRIGEPTVLDVGGAISLIMTGYLSRSTADIDIVDAIPEPIRAQHQLLNELQKRYGLSLTHFQSHYLPEGWQLRRRSLGTFGSLEVYAVDVYDVFIGKLFSKRVKDLDDLRVLSAKLDKDRISTQFQETTKGMTKEPELLKAARSNWYIVFGSDLPLTDG